MTVVYLDRVFFLNTIVDYLLLLTTAALAGTPMRRGRFALFAAVGGLYAVGTFLLPLLGTPVIRLLAGVAIAFFTFLRDPRPWRLAVLFLLLSGALGGLLFAVGLAVGSPTGIVQRIYYADISWGVLLSSALLFYALLHLLFRQGARYGGGDTVEITVVIQNRRCRLRALRDSGNALRDPIQGRPVLVAETAALGDIWDDTVKEILNCALPPEGKMAALYGREFSFTLLPYQAVGEKSGLLLAVRSDYLQIGRRRIPKVLVALTDTSIGNGCHGLWGGREKGEVIDDSVAEGIDPALTAVDRAG